MPKAKRKRRVTTRDVLRIMRDGWGWRLLYGQELRTSSLVEDCPVTWACRKLTGKRFPPHCFAEAARVMNLSQSSALALAQAAGSAEYHLENRTIKRLRRQLLRAAGLKEVER